MQVIGDYLEQSMRKALFEVTLALGVNLFTYCSHVTNGAACLFQGLITISFGDRASGSLAITGDALGV